MLGNVLECFGVCEVLQDKENDTNEILVHIPGLFPNADGEVTGIVEEQKSTTKSPTGDTTSSSGLRSNGTPATWMSMNTNRISSPNVRKGSKVVVYKFKGSSNYRWTQFGMDGSFRLETVIYAWSASPNTNQDSPLTPDNYYILTVSSHLGKFELVTGQGNGEPTPYHICLNTKEAKFSIVDGEENIGCLNSMEHNWTFANQDKSVFAIDKKNILLSSEDSIVFKATENIVLKTKILSAVCEESMTWHVGERTEITSPDIFIKGNIRHEGDTNQTGKHHSTGTIESDSDCVSAGVSGKSHKHKGVKRGEDETDIPSK